MIDTGGANIRPGGSEPTEPPGDDFPLPTFYINRDCDNERRASIEQQLKGASIVPHRITGVDALAVPDELRDYFFEGDKLISPLNPGEVGCYASHLRALATIIERDLDYGLVLEDDALVPTNMKEIARDLFAHLPLGWDVVHLCGDARRAVKPITQLADDRMLVRYSRIPSGAFGYLVSRAGAAKLLKPMKRFWPYDTDLRRPWLFNLQVYGVDPKVIKHGGTAASVIIAVGGRSRARRGLPIPSRGAWTGNPLHCPEGVFFNFKTLGPAWWFRCWKKNIASRLTEMLGLKALKRSRAAQPAPTSTSSEPTGTKRPQ